MLLHIQRIPLLPRSLIQRRYLVHAFPLIQRLRALTLDQFGVEGGRGGGVAGGSVLGIHVLVEQVLGAVAGAFAYAKESFEFGVGSGAQRAMALPITHAHNLTQTLRPRSPQLHLAGTLNRQVAPRLTRGLLRAFLFVFLDRDTEVQCAHFVIWGRAGVMNVHYQLL